MITFFCTAHPQNTLFVHIYVYMHVYDVMKI